MRLKKSFTVVLTTILLSMLSTPSFADLTLDKKQTKALADIIKAREFCEADLKIKNEALGSCYQTLAVPAESHWYQDPTIVVGGFAISFGIGAFFVASKCFGACR